MPNSLEDISLPNDIKETHLAYIEAAGEKALTSMLVKLREASKGRVVAIAGTKPNEYSAICSKQLQRILMACGYETIGAGETLPSYSTHATDGHKGIDFLDLTEKQAHYLVMATLPGGPGPNTSSWVGGAWPKTQA